MDEILPGLWVGDLACALSMEYLTLAGITHIVTAMKQRLPSSIPSSHLIHIPIDDEENEPLIVHFPIVNDFLTSILQEEWVEGQQGNDLDEQRKSDGKWGHWESTGDGTVLVHCQAGCSRSVALVVAYIMATRKWSRDDALALIKARRSQVQPNAGFMAQLTLFEEAGCEVDLRYKPIRRWLMSKVDVLNGGSVEDILMSYYPSPGSSPRLSRANSASGGSGGAASSTFGPLSSLGGSETSSDEVNIPTRRRRRSSVSSSTGRPDLSISPAMPTNADALFAAAAAAHDATAGPSNWSTSISVPHEVLIARSRGSRLPGGVSSLRGHEPRTLSAGSTKLPKPNYDRGTPRLRCRVCRREIAARDHVVEHEPGQGMMAFDVRKRSKEARNGPGAEAVGGTGYAGRPPASEIEQRFGRLRARSVDMEDGDEDEEQQKEHSGDSRTQEQDESTCNSASSSSAAPAVDGQRPIASRTASGRPVQSAASLTASLPPHLAALRAGRAPPGAQKAQQKALEESKARDRATSDAASNQPAVDGKEQSQPQQDGATAPPIPAASIKKPRAPSSSTRQPLLHSPSCSSYFLEPLDWMYSASSDSSSKGAEDDPTSLSSGQLHGKLLCPNRKRCNAKLGNWDWAGMQCGCGAWVTPAFAVHRSRVDEVL